MLYDFDRHGRQSYLSDFARFTPRTKIGPPNVHQMLVNKLCCHDRLQAAGFGDRKPELLGYLDGDGFHAENARAASVHELLTSERAIVVKPVNQGAGIGLQLIERGPEGIVRNGHKVTAEELKAYLSTAGPCIVERRVIQHRYASDLYPGTTNTLRLLTMRDVDTRQPFVAIAVQRIGTRRSGAADNWSRGGLSCHVELDSGVIGAGVAFPADPPFELQWHEIHPDTGQKLDGLTIPYWHQAVDLAVSLLTRLTYLHYVGWDIVITEHGPRVIEGNSFSDVNLLQVHRPLLADERVRRFYSHHGVI